jgi:hypothetical protein
MAMAMNVHEHGSPDKKGIFVDTRVLPFGHTWQAKNSLPQFLMNFFS